MERNRETIDVKIGIWASASGGGGPSSPDAVLLAHGGSPFASAYAWAAGWGAKFANPGALPTGTGNGAAFTPDFLDAVFAHDASPFVAAYPWSTGGFGSKYTAPATPPLGNAEAVQTARSQPPVGEYLVAFASSGIGSSTHVYLMSESQGGWGAKYGDPFPVLTSNARGVSWNNDSTAIAFAHTGTPFISAWAFASFTGFGTKFANPASLPPSNGNVARFSSTDDSIALSHDVTPFLSAWQWSGSGFGTRFSAPGLPVYPIGTGVTVRMNPANDSVILGHQFGSGGNCATAWDFSDTAFGALKTTEGPLPAITGSCNGLVWDAPGNDVFLAINPSPFIIAHEWNAGGFGTRYSAPGVLPPNAGNGVAVNQG